MYGSYITMYMYIQIVLVCTLMLSENLNVS